MSATDLFSKIPELHYTEEAPQIDVAEFRKLIQSRRSVRVFDSTRIPDAIVRECLEWALLSANSSNLQPWEFHWVRSPEKKAALVKACLAQPAAKTAAELIVCVARTGTWKRNARLMLQIFSEQNQRAATSGLSVPQGAVDYYRKLVPLVYGQGPLGIWGLLKKIILLVRGLFTATPREPTSCAEMRSWAHKTVSLACQTLMLGFRAHGYDTCPLEGFDSRRVRKLLDLPSDAFVTMIIAAGHRAPNGVYGPRVRFSSELFIKEV